jgi:hypothetical protein
MKIKTAIELRDLAKMIEQACLASPCAGPAMSIVRSCVDHLNCLARLHELNGMPDPPTYGD